MINSYFAAADVHYFRRCGFFMQGKLLWCFEASHLSTLDIPTNKGRAQ